VKTEERTKTADFRRSVARIAQYQPFGSGEVKVEFSRRAFVLAAAHENGGRLESLADCRDVCDGLWGLKLDIDEIRDVVTRLVEQGDLVADGSGHKLTERASTELSERVRDSSETEAEAFTEWELSLRALDADLTSEQIAELREDLGAWLQQIVTRHGIEAALLLYPEHEGAREIMSSVAAIGFDFLPKRDTDLEEIRPKALFSFIHRASAAQRMYLANLFTTAYMVAVFTLDPDASEAVQALTSGQRAYLDTNVVYSILNLNGPRAYLSVRRVLDLTRELGYQICVTPWTVAEMRKSVRLARDKLAKTTLPPRALAEIAAETSGDETFITAYWRKFKETGVSAKDFLDLHEQVEALLEKAGVEIVDEGCTAVDQDEDGLAAQIGLLEIVPGGANKSARIQEHDAKHRLLIDRLRGEGHRRFSNAGYWFITRDSILIPYAAEGRRAAESLPFAVSLPSWAQIVRSLSPRTENYEQTLVDLLDTPSVRPRGMVSYETVAEVLGRIEMLVEDSSEEIATRMLLDSAVMQELETKEEGERAGFIDNAVGEKKSELERHLRETQDAVAKERMARLAAEQKAAQEAAARREELEEARAARRVAEAHAGQKLADAEKRASDAEAQHRTAATHSQDEINDLREQVGTQVRLVKALIAVLLCALAAAVVAVPLAAGWITDGWPLVGLLLAGGAVVFAATAWLLGRKKATGIALVVGFILGLASSLNALVTSDDPDPATPANTR
jgi:hypothetical protein